MNKQPEKKKMDPIEGLIARMLADVRSELTENPNTELSANWQESYIQGVLLASFQSSGFRATCHNGTLHIAEIVFDCDKEVADRAKFKRLDLVPWKVLRDDLRFTLVKDEALTLLVSTKRTIKEVIIRNPKGLVFPKLVKLARFVRSSDGDIWIYDCTLRTIKISSSTKSF